MLKPFTYEHELAVTAILKNEAPYIAEWLDYHIAAGVTKFYLYDNESQDRLREALDPYIRSGLVEYTPFPGALAQVPAYNDFLTRHRFDCRYVAFIDADEFILPCDGTGKSIPEVLWELLAPHPDAAALVINWQFYGSAGQKKKDLSRGVLERFQYRQRDLPGGDGLFKSIVNPRWVELFVNPHFGVYFMGKNAISEHGNRVSVLANPDKTADRICINHYHTKSKEEWLEKRARGRAVSTGIMPMEMFDENDRNEALDDTILRYREKRLAPDRPAPRPLAERKQQEISFLLDELSLQAVRPNSIAQREGLENLFSYWHASRSSYRQYTDEATMQHISDRLLDRIADSMEGTHDFWELQMFLQTLPDLLDAAAHSKIKRRLCRIAEAILPQMIAAYRGWKDWSRCAMLETLGRYIQMLDS